MKMENSLWIGQIGHIVFYSLDHIYSSRLAVLQLLVFSFDWQLCIAEQILGSLTEVHILGITFVFDLPTRNLLGFTVAIGPLGPS